MQNQNSKVKIDLKKRAYLFALNSIAFIDKLNAKDMATKIISHQLIRSATSIGANIIEAQASSSRKDFTNFFTHSLKSSNETKFWLALLRDSHRADIQLTNELLKEVEELSKMLGSSILTLKGKRQL